MALVVKNLPASAGDITDMFNPRWERSSGGEHSNPLHYSCLESPMDRGAWWSTVHRVAKSQTWLKQFSACTHTHTRKFEEYYILIILVLINSANPWKRKNSFNKNHSPTKARGWIGGSNNMLMGLFLVDPLSWMWKGRCTHNGLTYHFICLSLNFLMWKASD